MTALRGVLKDTIENWPDVPDAAYWTLVSLPFLTLVTCCVWLRLIWPCPEVAQKDFTAATLVGDGSATEGTSLQNGTNG